MLTFPDKILNKKFVFCAVPLPALVELRDKLHEGLKGSRYHYTAEEKVTSFLTFQEIFWFLLYYFYIYHHIRCDTTGKVAREVGEIGP